MDADLKRTMIDITRSQQMTGETPLVGPIKGYHVKVVREDGRACSIALKMSKVGGAHIKNPEALITQIEDWVFMREKESE